MPIFMTLREKDYIVTQNFDLGSLDYSKLDDYIVGLNAFAFTAKKCFFVFDFYRHNFLHIKSYNEYFTEIPPRITEPYLFFNKKLLAEDVEFLYQIHHRAFAYMKNYKASETKKTTLFYNLRMINCFGDYAMTNIHINVLETDRQGNIWLALYVVEKSESENFVIPQLTLPDNYRYVFELNKQILAQLTASERSIAKLFFGNTTQNEIAKITHKSIHTVKSHMSSIYTKLKVSNKFDLQKKLLVG